MTAHSTAVHEASHAVAAFAYKVPITYVSIRKREDSAGRNRFGEFDIDNLDDLGAAVIKVAGEVGERMAAGASTSAEARFNWFSEGGDAEDARRFIARLEGDELANRSLATLKAYALLRTRWDVVEEIAAKLQKDTTVLGDEVSMICLADAARRSARAIAAKPPEPPRPDRAPKKPRRPKRAIPPGAEVRPFTFQVVKSKEG